MLAAGKTKLQYTDGSHIRNYIKHLYILFEKRFCAKLYILLKCNHYIIVLKFPYNIPVITVLTNFLEKNVYRILRTINFSE